MLKIRNVVCALSLVLSLPTLAAVTTSKSKTTQSIAQSVVYACPPAQLPAMNANLGLHQRTLTYNGMSYHVMAFVKDFGPVYPPPQSFAGAEFSADKVMCKYVNVPSPSQPPNFTAGNGSDMPITGDYGAGIAAPSDNWQANDVTLYPKERVCKPVFLPSWKGNKCISQNPSDCQFTCEAAK